MACLHISDQVMIDTHSNVHYIASHILTDRLCENQSRNTFTFLLDAK